jgi:ubiquinone/menaquinone biosynthesis C-methylase UbiE
MIPDANQKTYNDPAVIALYAKMEGLQPCEAAMFQRWIKPGSAVLDLGVGGGRTAGPLSKIADRYIGIDYSQGMVEACQARYPQLDFRHGDATDLSRFEDNLFDAVVFSFNGIDSIRTDECRAQCLREVARVLKPGGVFVFSSRNARVIGVWPQLRTARGVQVPWRIVYSLYASLRLAARSLSQAAFWKGSGYLLDPVHGGLVHYSSTPPTFAPQVESAGLEVVDVLGGRHPEVQAPWLTPWYYYACRKPLQPDRA